MLVQPLLARPARLEEMASAAALPDLCFVLKGMHLGG